MPHSYVSNLIHCAFSAKDRRRVINAKWEERVWAFMGGIARKNGFKALAVGGVEDHLHLLLSLPGTMPVAKAVQLVKAGSSKMIRATFTKDFEWQEGYGAFSIEETRNHARGFGVIFNRPYGTCPGPRSHTQDFVLGYCQTPLRGLTRDGTAEAVPSRVVQNPLREAYDAIAILKKTTLG